MSAFEQRPCLPCNGRRTFLLGVNYWSRAGGPRMWDRFDSQAVAAELQQMRQIGLNSCRSFAFIPSLMPAPGKISQQALAQMRRFFDICRENDIHTIPSLLVGHMSGENYDFVDQRGRSPYTDPEVIAWQAQLVRALAGAGAGHPAIVAYLASNEMPFWGGVSDPATIRNWAEGIRKTLRHIDDKRPFGLGDGAMNVGGGENGFNIEVLRQAGVVDFLGPHTYHADADPLRQALNAEFCLRSLTYTGLPVLFEEFGGSSSQMSEHNQRLYYREVLHSCLTSGATGALSWCFSDFDLVDQPPYSHHGFELGFGITRADGSEKPVCDELRAFAGLIERLDFASLKTPRPDAAIVVPAYYNTTYPFSCEDRQRMRGTLLQAYALCCTAGIEAELVIEHADLSRYRLLLAPATQKLLAPTWRFLVDHAAAGNTVYWSYFGGDYDFHQAAWCHNFAQLTGNEHLLRYGNPDLPPPELSIHGEDVGITINTDVGPPFPRAFVPIEPIAARGTDVLARDQFDRAALTRVAHGAGKVLLCAYPLEYYLAAQYGVSDASGSCGLYRLLAEQAGIATQIRVDAPQVQSRVLRGRRADYLWLINHAWSDQVVAIDTPGGTPIFGGNAILDSGRQSIELAPKHVQVIKLAEPRPRLL